MEVFAIRSNGTRLRRHYFLLLLLPAERASLHLDDQDLSAGVRVDSDGVIVAGGGAGGRRDVLDQAIESEVYGLVSKLLARTVTIEVKLARPMD